MSPDEPNRPDPDALLAQAKKQGRGVWLYDTFEGMAYEDAIDTIHIGEIKSDEMEVRDALGEYGGIFKCVFPNTTFLPEPPIAFAHIDCDQYRAIIETCKALEPLMAEGGIMWFDDVPVLPGARKAVEELYAGRIEPVGNARLRVVF